MEWVGIVWAASVLVAGALVLLLTLILIPILNPRFDTDWKGHYHELTRKSMPFFGVMRTVQYAGAVTSKFLAWRIFRDRKYDFRGRVGCLVYALCVIQQVAIIYGFLSIIIYLVLEAVGISIV